MYSKGLFNKAEKQGVIAGFREWLALQNYGPVTVKYAPQRIAEFIDWCCDRGIKEDHARQFFDYQKRRKNKRRYGALSVSYLRIYLSNLRLFRRFLREVGHIDLEINIIYRTTEVEHYQIFTRREIQRLYRAVDEDLLGMRDRAMLAVYYGCGLRRTEGVSLLVDDILPDKNLLFVRRGKNYKQRYVPIVGEVKKDILDYLTIARQGLLAGGYEATFFIGISGRALSGNSMYERLKRLMRKAGITKSCGLHSLRHSIATHLLESGMPLHQIAKLLGHSSMDTTQIYTHILKDTKDDKRKGI